MEHHKNFSLQNLSTTFKGIVYIEKWKPVKGYEGLYEISSFGRLKNVKRNKINKWSNHSRGYLTTLLSKNDKNKCIMAHTLVIAHFIGHSADPQKWYTNHIDCRKKNNFYKNLEWVTPKENIQHALQNGLMVGPRKNKKVNLKLC